MNDNESASGAVLEKRTHNRKRSSEKLEKVACGEKACQKREMIDLMSKLNRLCERIWKGILAN